MRDIPSLSDRFFRRLKRAVGDAEIIDHGPGLEAYAWDNTGERFLPQAVVLAENMMQVRGALRICADEDIPITPRGAGTGNVGGALAVSGGVVLSLSRMNRILDISPSDRFAIVEPGVINQQLQKKLQPHNLFWPPDPSSKKACSIGGNLAMCSAGPNAVRYGVVRDWVMALEAVLPTGEVIKTGSKTSKGVVGFDLTRLLVGSEGALAVITKATLKLAPRPESRHLMRALFNSIDQAANAVMH
ncbi:FAD-binding oxidoreductase, partial [Magnetococcales bacterium HHB-1]